MYPYIDPSSMFPDKYADMPGPIQLSAIPSAVSEIQNMLMDPSPKPTKENSSRCDRRASSTSEVEEVADQSVDGRDPLESSSASPPHRLVRKNRISHHKMQNPHPLNRADN